MEMRFKLAPVSRCKFSEHLLCSQTYSKPLGEHHSVKRVNPGSGTRPYPHDGRSFARAILGNDIGTGTGRAPATLAEAESGAHRKQDLREFVARVLSEDWDPAKHPRGGYPENRGWFSPTWGAAGLAGAALAGIGAWLDAAAESPNPQAPWYDDNKNKSDVIAKIRGRNTTIHFENTTKEYRGKLADVVKKSFNAVDSINDDIKNGTLTKDSPAIKTYFGDLSDKQFDSVKQVFAKIAEAPNHPGTLTIRTEKKGPEGKVTENDVIGVGVPSNPDLQLGKRSTRVTLYPPYFQKQADDQVARYVHELSHEGGNTKDYGYWDEARHGYVVGDKDVRLTTDQKVSNANNYERLVRSRLKPDGGNR